MINIIKEIGSIHFNDNPIVIFTLIAFLLGASYTDIKHLKIYDKFNIFMLFTRIVVFTVFLKYQQNFINDYITGGALMFISFLLVGMFGRTKMGGDIKFAGNLGLWLGFKASFFLVIILILSNLIFRLFAKKRGRVALAPFFLISYLLFASFFF